MSLFLRTMCDMEDGRQMRLTPVNGVWEAADQHQYGIGVDAVETAYLILIG